ncbi:MAG: hypothetical protein WCH11_00450 [Bdellovibrio sp.]
MNLHQTLVEELTKIISETNGITLLETLKLLSSSDLQKRKPEAWQHFQDFQRQVELSSLGQKRIDQLLDLPASQAFIDFFRSFPLKYKEEHIHLTGSLSAQFIFPRLQKLLEGPQKEIYKKKIVEVYGNSAWPIHSVEDVARLIQLDESEGFDTYLRILYLPKLILLDRQAHFESAFHLAEELWNRYNVGSVRLKFMLSRASSKSQDQIPGADSVTSEDVLLGLAEGFWAFQKIHPDFQFVLSPSFRKEREFFDSSRFHSKKEHFEYQVNELVQILERHPSLARVVTEVDTVGDEKNLFRKEHFNEFSRGFRKLQYRGFRIRSHHGETFYTLKKGIQAVDNAMNIWHIDTLEHGLALGINPNSYFHRIYQLVKEKNQNSLPVVEADSFYRELVELDWGPYRPILDKLLAGLKLTEDEDTLLIKAKFHTAREVEQYQHDVLNRLIQKGVTLVTLPSSNKKLTGQFDDYKDHPFSWWEKKSVQLGVGTDNYVTLKTDFLKEMLIILLTDPFDLKITKLLMVTTGENRRPHISHLLWKMRKRVEGRLS